MKTAAYIFCFIVGGNIAAAGLRADAELIPIGGSASVNYLAIVGFGMVSIGLLALGDRLVRAQYHPRPVAGLRASYLLGSVCAPLIYFSCFPGTHYSRSEVRFISIAPVDTNGSAVVEGQATNTSVELVDPVE